MKHTLKTHVMALAAASLMLATSAAHAEDLNLPAVSKLNGSMSLSGIYHNSDDTSEGVSGMLSGSLSVPLTHSFGFQADATAATNDDDGVAGIGGHLFWRDPAKGLIGLTGAYVTVPNVAGVVDLSVTRVGGEGEFYLGNLTLAFSGGYQDGQHLEEGSYGTAKASWYANDNLRLGIGASHDPVSDTTGIADIEYQPDFGVQSGMTFFASTAIGKNDLAIGQAGIRFYFGDPKSLKRRNREDDPTPMTDEILKQISPSMYSKYCAGSTPYKFDGVTCGYVPPPV